MIFCNQCDSGSRSVLVTYAFELCVIKGLGVADQNQAVSGTGHGYTEIMIIHRELARSLVVKRIDRGDDETGHDDVSLASLEGIDRGNLGAGLDILDVDLVEALRLVPLELDKNLGALCLI